jgi:hypothetical protein
MIRIMVQDLSKQLSYGPVRWEAIKVGGSQSEASPGKNAKTHSKKITEVKWAGGAVDLISMSCLSHTIKLGSQQRQHNVSFLLFPKYVFSINYNADDTIPIPIQNNNFWGWTRIRTQGFMLTNQALYCVNHTSSPFCSGCFGDEVSQTICPGWPQTSILPISASQVARITGVSHRHWFRILYLCILQYWGLTLQPIP